MPTEYTGSCHCGAIGLTYHCDLPAERWAIRACQCTFCRAHAALSTSDPGSRISFSARTLKLLQKYRFGLKTADFLLCRNCGVYIGAIIVTAKGAWGIVNVHALHDRPADLAPAAPISYDSEDTAERVTRREQRWSPVVGYPG